MVPAKRVVIGPVADLGLDTGRIDNVGEHHRDDPAAGQRQDLSKLFRIDPGEQLLQLVERHSLVRRHPPYFLFSRLIKLST